MGSLSLKTKRLPEGVVLARLELWVAEGGDSVSANLAGGNRRNSHAGAYSVMESFWGRHSGFRECGQLHIHSCELKPVR